MKKVLLVRYGEIHLKGKNRGVFERALVENIKHALRDFAHKFEKFSGRYVVSEFDENKEQEIVDALLCVAGIHSISVAFETDSEFEKIAEGAVLLSREFSGSFRVTVNRADKTFGLDSMTLARELGSEILKMNSDLKVDLYEPNFTLYVDVRENHKTYFFHKILHGVGGMPVGTSGKGLLLLSGGIDSPVAGYRMIKRGMKLDCVHFESFPHTSRAAEEKAIELAGVLEKYNGKTRIFVVSVAEIQEHIHHNCSEEYMITLVRRFMLRIAERIAKQNDCQAIVTGESLGQVASQTIESMTVIGDVLNLPLLRPLVANDKQETVEIAQKIGSLDISIRPFDDCCTVYLPDAPVIKPKLWRVEKEESKLDVERLIENAISTMRIRFADEV